MTAATVTTFALPALAVWDVPGLSTGWPTLTVVACLLSAVLLVMFRNGWLVSRLAIDVALLVVVVTHPR